MATLGPQHSYWQHSRCQYSDGQPAQGLPATLRAGPRPERRRRGHWAGRVVGGTDVLLGELAGGGVPRWLAVPQCGGG
ncbi:MAG: hypothetical protein ACKOFW_19615, partial [Planctomycetaceae bacterium]